LTPRDIGSFIRTTLGEAEIASSTEISGGGYAAVWKVSLRDGREVVLKVGPPPDVPQLRYERGLMAAEAYYFRTVRPLGVPVPEVLHADFGVTLPVAPQRLRRMARSGALDEVTRPALVHFDLWDGNVLTPDGARLTGLVDGERFLCADPLIDFVSPAIGTPIEEVPSHPFALGHGGVVWDEAAMRRLALYRMHLLLLMVVEGPSRGMSARTQAQRAAWLEREVGMSF
jgi:hypothetical protein